MKKIIVLVSIIVVVSIISAGSYSLGKRFSGVTAPVTADAVKEERKILYYRNPMGLPDTSPVPKKDAMGMDYVPVYDGDAVQEEGGVNISVEKVQKLGVKSEAATLRGLNKTIHATGRIEIDERRTYTIAPKFEGWVEHLYVNSTGETVNRGQALFDVYSPELVSAQREYAIAAQGEAKLENADEETKAGMKQLADASLARLKNWDITPGEIKQLTTGKSRAFINDSPVNLQTMKEFVLEKTGKDAKIFGDDSIVPLLALETKRQIAFDIVDTNPQAFSSGLVKIEEVLEKIRKNGALFVVRNKQGISSIREVQNFLNTKCGFVSSFHDKKEGDFLFYSC